MFAFLCVQENPMDRTSMSSVVLMLECYPMTLQPLHDWTCLVVRSIFNMMLTSGLYSHMEKWMIAEAHSNLKKLLCKNCGVCYSRSLIIYSDSFWFHMLTICFSLFSYQWLLDPLWLCFNLFFEELFPNTENRWLQSKYLMIHLLKHMLVYIRPWRFVVSG